MTDTTTPVVGGKVRVLDSEYVRQTNLLEVGAEVEVIAIPTALTGSTVVRVQADDSRPMLINDSFDTEFEVVS